MAGIAGLGVLGGQPGHDVAGLQRIDAAQRLPPADRRGEAAAIADDVTAPGDGDAMVSPPDPWLYPHSAPSTSQHNSVRAKAIREMLIVSTMPATTATDPKSL